MGLFSHFKMGVGLELFQASISGSVSTTLPLNNFDNLGEFTIHLSKYKNGVSIMPKNHFVTICPHIVDKTIAQFPPKIPNAKVTKITESSANIGISESTLRIHKYLSLVHFRTFTYIIVSKYPVIRKLIHDASMMPRLYQIADQKSIAIDHYQYNITGNSHSTGGTKYRIFVKSQFHHDWKYH